MAAKINRTGKTYGDLTVLETIPGSNSKADTYLVKCNCCGNTMIIGIDALLKGLKCKDCRGKDRKRTYQDLVGEEHNGIKVISLAEDAIGSTGHRNIRYNCMCSCGKEFVAYRSSLLRGKVKSCGCCKHITEASKMLVDNAEAMQDYLEFCYGNNGNKLGTYQEVLVEPKLYVVNLFGQNGYGRGKRQTNYAALAAALFSFFRDCAQKNQDVTIRLPYGLGCGLAGGDWNTVLDIISDAAKAWNLNVEIWELQQ